MVQIRVASPFSELGAVNQGYYLISHYLSSSPFKGALLGVLVLIASFSLWKE
ncbi:hypothetical protein BDV25DRAFT_162252 [Aspergillus avenaceus]|uniref:Uncharacterized protein n=1 Tax=Aspergillus avenaceus TaxID=36643 RepID=A0A5N6TJK2_ASPAV|nr:hypothetical protein BDV25DRAFT_162252 [Aspergillus avenaceus]